MFLVSPDDHQLLSNPQVGSTGRFMAFGGLFLNFRLDFDARILLV